MEPGCRLPAVLSAVCPQETGEVDREARVSPFQDQEEGVGELSAHRLHRGVGYGDRAAAAGSAAPQRARVPSELRGEDPLSHGERAGRTLVRVRASGRGAGGTREYRTRGGDRSGDQAAGDSLRWDGDPQSSPPQTTHQEAQAVTANGEPEAERQPQPQEGGAQARQAASADQEPTTQYIASGHHQAGENQVRAGD